MILERDPLSIERASLYGRRGCASSRLEGWPLKATAKNRSYL